MFKRAFYWVNKLHANPLCIHGVNTTHTVKALQFYATIRQIRQITQKADLAFFVAQVTDLIYSYVALDIYIFLPAGLVVCKFEIMKVGVKLRINSVQFVMLGKCIVHKY